LCLVCGSAESEPHFGGHCCRACAAFFRRYYQSKKITKKCTCKERKIKSHPCRECRIAKCIAIGMSPDKLQGFRDKNLTMEVCQNTPSGSSTSLLAARIIPRTTSTLEFAIPNWHEFERMRKENSREKTDWLNIYEISCMIRMDINLTWKMVDKMFPLSRKLDDSDKKALLRHFILKFWQIWPIFDCIKNTEDYESMKKNNYEKMIVGWYGGCFKEGKEMSNNEIIRVFEPFWSTFYSQIVPPIIGLKLENEELMAIVWLLFFDNAYTNISQECEEICRNIKKVILRELKNYQIDKNFEEMRLLDTVETLELIEKSEQKFLEEMMICEMHHVRIHDDFKAILKE
ncbi:Protein CBR-NHR-112, partial [Caenorhabditis briggsae]